MAERLTDPAGFDDTDAVDLSRTDRSVLKYPVLWAGLKYGLPARLV